VPKKSSKPKQYQQATLAIHGPGREPKAYFAVSTPIVQTSNYYFDSTAEVLEFMKAKSDGRVIREHEYGRYGNPTQQECERKLAALEGAERALLFSTGMSAVVMTLLACMRRNGHIIFTKDCYRQTRDFAYDFVKQNWDPLMAKLPTDTGAILPYVAAGYCDAEHRQDVQNFFSGRSTKYTGGPRILTQVLEGINLCIAYKNAQEASVAEFLKTYKPAQSASGGSL